MVTATHDFQQNNALGSILPWAAFCLAFFGFMRSVELTASSAGNQANLQVNNVTVDSRVNPQLLTIHLSHSKTDQFGAGHYIHLGRTSRIVCLVAAMLGYLSRRPTSGTRNILFIFENGSPLTRPQLVSHLVRPLPWWALTLKHSLAAVFELVQQL